MTSFFGIWGSRTREHIPSSFTAIVIKPHVSTRLLGFPFTPGMLQELLGLCLYGGIGGGS